jgi:hypothetical protein
VYNAVLFMLLFIKSGGRWEMEICFPFHPSNAREEGDINKEAADNQSEAKNDITTKMTNK